MRLALVVLVSLSVSSSAYGQLIANGDFEAPAIAGPGQTPVGPNEIKPLVIDPLHPAYEQAVSGIPNWMNSFTDVGFGAGFRDAGLNRIDFAGSGDTQYAFINNWETRLSQVTSKLVTPNSTLSADVLVGLSGPAQAGRFQLWAGAPDSTNPDLFPATAVLLSEVSVASPGWGGFVPDLTRSVGAWHPLDLTYTAPRAGAMLGQPITVSFITSGGSAGPTFWDNASLTVVPEPAAGTVAALVITSAFLWARRRTVCMLSNANTSTNGNMSARSIQVREDAKAVRSRRAAPA